MLPIKIKLDEKFFEEEVRCEYKISTAQKKVWAIELDLLNELTRVCNKYNIVFTATSGTLLGAVRHQGFIPWDDDLDIAMTRDNLEKLIEHEKEFKHPYFLQHALSDKKYYIEYARLRNSETTGIITEMAGPDFNNGIFIDICVFDDCPKHSIPFRYHFKKQWYIKKIVRLYNSTLEKENYKWRIVGTILKKTYFKMVSYEKIVKKHTDFLTSLRNAKYCGSLYIGNCDFVRKTIREKRDMNSITWLPFENINIPVPKKYDQYLRNEYGDYMCFPPVEKRGAWHDGIIYFDPDISYLDFYK